MKDSSNPSRDWFNNQAGKLSLTQCAIANTCGVPETSLKSWLVRKRVPQQYAATLCKVLNVSQDQLEARFTLYRGNYSSGRNTRTIHKIDNLVHLMTALVETRLKEISLEDMQFVLNFPFDFSKELSPEKVTAIKILLEERYKQTTSTDS